MTTDYLSQQIDAQRAQHPTAIDVQQWMTRYLFVPFRDRDLTLKMQGDFGVVGSLRAGYILPFSRRQQPVIDYGEVKRVPTYSDGTYHPSSVGVSTIRLDDRAPSRVIDAIFRIFNAHHGTDENQDNGICEIECLRGIDDMELVRELNNFCLPERYNTARAQIAQLESASHKAPTPLHFDVIQRLLDSTRQSISWAKWHYANLEADMEDKEKTGKDRLSPLDKAVCVWIERAEPKFRSNLNAEATPVIVQGVGVQPASPPTVQHKRCGTFLNLVDGKPPEFCYVCQKPFDEGVKAEAELIIEPEPTFDPNNPMGEQEDETVRNQRLAAEQARMREKMKGQRK